MEFIKHLLNACNQGKTFATQKSFKVNYNMKGRTRAVAQPWEQVMSRPLVNAWHNM